MQHFPSQMGTLLCICTANSAMQPAAWRCPCIQHMSFLAHQYPARAYLEREPSRCCPHDRWHLLHSTLTECCSSGYAPLRNATCCSLSFCLNVQAQQGSLNDCSNTGNTAHLKGKYERSLLIPRLLADINWHHESFLNLLSWGSMGSCAGCHLVPDRQP